MNRPTGKLIIFSGPSGAGKTTLLRRVFEESSRPLVMSVSATTRPPRPGEKDGEDYHFLTPEEFQAKREAGEFLECFEVFGRGYWYGTLRSSVIDRLQSGQWVVLEIDVQGCHQVVKKFPDAVTIFVRPRSLETLESRLRQRGTENEETIQRRLEVARREMKHASEYQYQVENESMDRAVDQICGILEEIGNKPS